MRTYYDRIDEMKSPGRVLAPVLLAEVVGALLGLGIGYHYDPFTNLWMGGATAAPIGLFIGVVWHFRSGEAAKDLFTGAMAIIALGSIGIGLMAAFQAIPSAVREMNLLERMRTLDEAEIRRIAIYDENGETLLMVIDDRQTIVAFAAACRDVEGYSPNHPSYLLSWRLRVEAVEPLELECHYEEGYPFELKGDFIETAKDWTSYHGSFSSVGLLEWMEGQVPANWDSASVR